MVTGRGTRFCRVKGAVTERYLRAMKSVCWVLKSIKLLMLYVLALTTKKA
jgi:hypothetical protein